MLPGFVGVRHIIPLFVHLWLGVVCPEPQSWTEGPCLVLAEWRLVGYVVGRKREPEGYPLVVNHTQERARWLASGYETHMNEDK
jgi:hypothetical protein